MLVLFLSDHTWYLKFSHMAERNVKSHFACRIFLHIIQWKERVVSQHLRYVQEMNLSPVPCLCRCMPRNNIVEQLVCALAEIDLILDY